MISLILKQLHFLIIGYSIFGLWQLNSEQEQNLINIKNKIPILTNSIELLTVKKKNLDRYYENIEQAKIDIEQVAKEVELLQQKLPSESSTTSNLAMIKNVASKMNIKKIFLSPKSRENKGFYFINKIQFKGMGTYLQFLIFFERISESKQLVNISTLSLKVGKEKRRGRFQIINAEANIDAYQYNVNFKENRGISDIEKNFKNQKGKEIINNKKSKKKKR